MENQEQKSNIDQPVVMRSIVLADLKKAFEAGQEQKRAEDWSYNAGYDREHPRYDKTADITFDYWLKQYFA
jgi:hypothetical protein